MQTLATEKQLEELWQESHKTPIVLFKHSRDCVTSATIHGRLEIAVKNKVLPEIHRVVVQEAPAVSEQITKKLSLTHETPQIILVYEEQLVYDADHWEIKVDELEKIIKLLV